MPRYSTPKAKQNDSAAKEPKPEEHKQKFLCAVSDWSKKFLIQSKSFAGMLEASIRKYQNRAVEATAVIQELIELARQMRGAGKRGDNLRLTEDELAFYDALEVNDSAVPPQSRQQVD